MNCSTNITMVMGSNKMAVKALELMKEFLTQANADEFECECRESFDRFANDLMVKGSKIMSTSYYCLEPETYHIILPEMFKVVAHQFFFNKFSGYIYCESNYGFEEFGITYEKGKLVMETLHHDYCGEPYCDECFEYHDNCEEPSCEECDDRYDYFEEDGVAGYRCCDCGHTITVEEFKAACEQYFENVYEIL